MAISAQRFQFLDKETNIGIASFDSKIDSSIFNDPANMLKTVNTEVQDLIGSATQLDLKSYISPAITNPIEAATRVSKDLRSRVTDFAKLPSESVDGVLGTISGGNAAMQKSLKNMLSKCSANGLKNGIPGKPFDTSINCGKGDVKLGPSQGASSCDASSYNDVLSKLTGGEYNAAYKDMNKALQTLMALSGYGYDLKMCGVFSALGAGLPNDVLSKASGGLLGMLGASGNTNGVLDLIGSSVGLSPLMVVPDGISTFLNNFSTPSNILESQLPDLSDRVMGGLELLDDQWSFSDYDDMLSMSEVDFSTDDLSQCFEAGLGGRDFDIGDIDFVPAGDSDFLMGAYMMA